MSKHIDRVTFDGFKGGSGQVDLAPRTVLTGANGSGKTRTMEAIQTGILGHVPKHGRRALAGLMSTDKDRMTVGVRVSDGEPIAEVERRFDRSAAGVSGQKLRWNGGKLQSEAAVADKLAAEFGGSAVALDVGELLRMTAGERTKALLGFLPSAEVSREEFVAAVEKADGDTLPPSVRLHLAGAWDDGEDLPERLRGAQEAIRELIAAETDKKRRRQDSLAEDQARLADQPMPGPAPALEEIEQADEDLEYLRAKLEGYQSHVVELARWEEAVRNAEAALADAEKRKADAEQLAREIAAETPPEQSPTLAELEADRREKQAAADAIHQEWKALHKRRQDADTSVAEARTKHEILAANLADIEGCSSCPTCNQGLTSDAKRALEEMVVAARGDLAQREDVLRAIDKELAESGEEVERAHRASSQALYASEKAQRTLNEWEAARTHRKGQVSMTVTEAGGSIDRATKSLGDLRGRRPEGAPPAGWNADFAKAEIAEKQAALDALRAARAAEADWRALQRTIADHESAIDSIDETAAAYRQVARAVTEASASLIADALSPLTATTSELLHGVDPAWRLEVSTDQGLELLAWTGGERPVPFSSLSGGEAVAFIAALGVALIRLIDPPLRVLLIEAAEVDAGRLPALLDAIDTFGADLHTVVVATCHAGVVLPPWELVELGAPVAEEVE